MARRRAFSAARSVAFISALAVFGTACADDPGGPSARPCAGRYEGNGDVAFVEDADVFVRELDGDRVRRLTRNRSNTLALDPVWSPDGTRIAFVEDRRDPRTTHPLGFIPARIVLVNADGGGRTTLAFPDLFLARPYVLAWSPDCTRIAFAGARNPPGVPEDCEGLECLEWLPLIPFHLYSATVEGGDLTRLTGGDVIDSAPTWSPDGTRVAFLRDLPERIDDPATIHDLHLETGSVRVLLPLEFDARSIAWSPDGSRLLLEAGAELGNEIYVVGVDGSGLSKLAGQPPDLSMGNTDPEWSPDGRRIAFSRWTDDEMFVYTMNADGTEKQRLSRGCCPSWQPTAST